MSVILGLDPGFASLGVAVVELRSGGESVRQLHVIRTSKSDRKRGVRASDDNVRRAREIARQLGVIIGTTKPRAICAESMSFPRSSSVAGKMCLAWGVVATLSHVFGTPLVQASPKEVKLAACGDGGASKEDVIAAMRARFPECASLTAGINRGEHEHCFDALAAVVACLDSEVLRLLRGVAA